MTHAPFSVSSRSGSDEQYTEKDQLLTELATLQKEKDPPPANATAAARAERTVALQLRDDACATLGQKRSADKSEKEPEGKRRATASIADNKLLYFEKKDEREEEAAIFSFTSEMISRRNHIHLDSLPKPALVR